MKIFTCHCLGCHAPETAHGFLVLSDVGPVELYYEWRRLCSNHEKLYADHFFKTRKEAKAYIVEQALCP